MDSNPFQFVALKDDPRITTISSVNGIHRAYGRYNQETNKLLVKTCNSIAKECPDFPLDSIFEFVETELIKQNKLIA